MAMFGQIPEDEMICQGCGSNDLIEDTREGNLTCTACGLVNKDNRIDMHLETRTFEEDDANEVRASELVGTLADRNALAATGIARMAPGANPKSNAGQLSRAQMKMADKRDEKLEDHSKMLHRLTMDAGLNESHYRAAWEFYRDFEEKTNFREVDEVMLACIYIASRDGEHVRQMADLAKLASKPTAPNRINARVTEIKETLKLKLGGDTTHGSKHVMRYGSELQLPFNVNQLAQDIAQNMSTYSVLEGKNPRTIAAVAIWMATRLREQKISHEEIARRCDITEGTLVKNYREIVTNGVQRQLSATGWQDEVAELLRRSKTESNWRDKATLVEKQIVTILCLVPEDFHGKLNLILDI